MLHDKAISILVEECGIPYSSWLAYFPHDGTITGISGGLGVDYDTNQVPPSSGGDFSGENGCFFFDKPTGLEDFTIIAKVANKSTDSGGLIFSTLSSGVNTDELISGFSFGVTHSNRLFVETYSENGAETFVTDFAIPNTGIVNLTKSRTSFVVGYYDTNTSSSITNTHDLDQSTLPVSDFWYFGGPINDGSPYVSGVIDTNFYGSITNLSIFSGCLRPDEVDRISLGCVITGTTAETTGYDPAAIRNTRFNSLAIYDQFDETDIFTTALSTGNFKTGFNYDAFFNSTLGYFESTDLPALSANLFVNGVGQCSGTGIVTGRYDQYVLPSRDYVAQDYSFIGDTFSLEDRAVFDLASGSSLIYDTFNHSGLSGQLISGAATNSEIYFNGILLSTLDYSKSGVYYVFASGNALYGGVTGVLSINYYNYEDTQKLEGSGVAATYDSFVSEQSVVYINGVRQNLSEDYDEIPSRDYRNGTGIRVPYSLTFNNNTGFLI